jgi:2TM family of unknown function (DUF5676)
MKLDARAFGLAAGLMVGVLFIVCAVAVAVAPEATTAFAGHLIHSDLTGITRSLTLGSFVGGLVCWTAGTTVAFWFMGAVYNRLAAVGLGTEGMMPGSAAQRV